MQLDGKSVDDVNTPKPQPLPSIPSLPTGSINGNTVDCVNVSECSISATISGRKSMLRNRLTISPFVVARRVLPNFNKTHCNHFNHMNTFSQNSLKFNEKIHN